MSQSTTKEWIRFGGGIFFPDKSELEKLLKHGYIQYKHGEQENEMEFTEKYKQIFLKSNEKAL